MAIGWHEPADIHAEAPGQRRAYLISIEHLALDFARLDDFFRKRAQGRFGTQREAKAFHASDQPALPVADSG